MTQRGLWLYGAIVVISVLFLSMSASAQTADTPWPMFRHDLRHTGSTPYTGPAEPTVYWTLPADDGIVSSPSIGEDGTIYVGVGGYYGSTADTSFYAINPDGSLKWRYPTDGGVFSSPAIAADGTIYFGSADYHIYALEDSVTYGKMKWRTMMAPWVYSSPTIASDGTIYVGGLNFRIYSLWPDGNVRWSHQTGWCVFSSAAIGSEGEVYIGSKDHYVYAFEDSVTYPKFRWQFPTGVFYDGHLVDSSPAIGPNGTIYVGTDPYGAAGQEPVPVDTVFFAINPDGTLKWTVTMGDGAESSPAIGPDGMIYVGSYDGNLYAIRDEGDQGVVEWTFPTGGSVDGSPTVDGCGTIYVGSRDSTLYAINPDGSLRWSFPTGDGIECSPTIDDNGVLYIGSFDGNLYALGSPGSDVGVVSIDVPDAVAVETTYVPTATARNYRTGAGSFNVSCLIDSAGEHIYADTAFASGLAETTSVQVAFTPWTVGPDTGVVYTVTVETLLEGDSNASNDTLSTQAKAVGELADVPTPDDAELRPLSVDQISPNPFSATSVIQYSVSPGALGGTASDTHVSLKIYDATGRLVRLLDHGPKPAGTYSAAWDGRDDRGAKVATGIYFCRLEAAGLVDARKVVFVR